MRKSLKNILTINFILAAVLPVIVIGIASHTLLTQSLTSSITTKNLSLSKSLSGEIETFLSHPLSILKHIIFVVDEQLPVTNISTNNYLQSVIKNFDIFDMIQILDDDGKVIFVAPYDYEFLDNDMSNLPFYRATIKINTHFWSPTFISMQTGKPTLTLSLPMKSGMIVGYLNLQILSKITEKIQISGQGYAIVTDQKGNTLSHPNSKNVFEQLNLKHLNIVQEGLAGHEGTYRDILDDHEIIGSISIVPQTKWLVIIAQQSSEAFASVFKIKLMIAIGFVCTAIIAVLIALGSLNKALQPFSFLISSVKRVASGNYDTDESIPKSYFEIDELSENFNKMTNAVKDRQKSILESERVYRSLVEAIPYGIHENDLDGIITFTNSSYEKIFECGLGKMVGKPIWTNEINNTEKSNMQKFFANLLVNEPKPTQYQTKIKTQIGNIIDIRVNWDYKRDEKGQLQGFIFVITDTTDQIRMEENLRQAHKMEAIGTLTGGIAHDFNNILAAILGYSELVKDDLPEDSENRHDMETVISAANRAKDLVKHMLTFSRKSDQDFGPIELHLIVKEALKLLRASIPATIDIRQRIDTNSGVIDADPTQIHQVLMNLCTNATYAMEKNGGVLEVVLEVVDLSQNDVTAEPGLQPGSFIKLTVSDNGIGIDRNDFKRIFDPFFTTKETGKGTGMGLSVVHGIVKNHGGMIKVESEFGVGTSFDVYFPKVSAVLKQETNSSSH